MNFYSLNKQAPKIPFATAVIKGIAPDRGLYFPEEIRPLPELILRTDREIIKSGDRISGHSSICKRRYTR